MATRPDANDVVVDRVRQSYRLKNVPSSVLSSIVLLAIAPFVGSFLGTVILRLPRGLPIADGRSVCDSCGCRLRAIDVIPLGSWILLTGRCRYCSTELSIFYPAFELSAFIIAAWSLAVLPGWLAWAGALFGWTLLALAVIDHRQGLLPDRITLPLAAAGLIVAWLISHELLPAHLIGAAAGYLSLLALAVAYRLLREQEGLGGGDAKLFGAIGAWVGWQGLPTVLLCAALTALLWTVLTDRRAAATTRIAFGPHLALGGWLVWLYGPLLPG